MNKSQTWIELAEQRAREAEPRPCEAEALRSFAGAAEACRAHGWAEACPWRTLGASGAIVGVCALAERERLYSQQCGRLLTAGVPLRERAIILAALRPESPIELAATAPLRAVDSWAVDPLAAALLVLGGSRGVGKTIAACWALAWRAGLYLTAYELAPGLNMHALKSAELLVIDQVGRETRGASDYARLQLEELIDARHARREPTILCCNLNERDFRAEYDGAITDRLNAGRFVFVRGASMRKQEGGQ